MKDITTLVGERYLTGFLINAVCLKYCNEGLLRASASLYLPSFTQTWASSGSLLSLNSKLKPYIYTAVCVNVQWILTRDLLDNVINADYTWAKNHLTNVTNIFQSMEPL